MKITPYIFYNIHLINRIKVLKKINSHWKDKYHSDCLIHIDF